MLQLITACLILKESYHVDFEQLMPYLINILTNKNQIRRETQSNNFDRSSDVILSERIIQQSKIIEDITKNLEKIKQKTGFLLSILIIEKYAENSNFEKVSSETGSEEWMINSAIENIQNLGYKVLKEKSGNFNLVKA